MVDVYSIHLSPITTVINDDDTQHSYLVAIFQCYNEIKIFFVAGTQCTFLMSEQVP